MAMQLLEPFAVDGLREDFDINPSPENDMSVNKGFTALFALKPEEGGKFIDMLKFNQLLYLMSKSNVEFTTQSFPNWIDDKGDGLPFAYPKNAIVKYTDGNTYVSLIDDNEDNPIGSANWRLFEVKSILENNITINVGTGGDFATINEALEYLTKSYYPMYKKSGITATINLKVGFVMAEQVLVRGLNLGWITIVGEDAETIITHTALTTAFNGASYPAFGVDKGGTSPVIGQLFRFNVEKAGENKHGLMTFGAGSSANVLSGCGFIGAGNIGIYALNVSTINADNANASNAGTYGIFASLSSTINARGANVSNAGTYGIFASLSSTINALNAIIQNQTTGSSRIRVQQGSIIYATGIDTTGGTVPALSQAANTLTGNGIIYQ